MVNTYFYHLFYLSMVASGLIMISLTHRRSLTITDLARTNPVIFLELLVWPQIALKYLLLYLNVQPMIIGRK